MSKKSVKDKIANEVLQLLKSKKLEEITIVDLVKSCNISRQTFYYHFHDITEVVEYIISQRINVATSKMISTTTPEEHIEIFADCYLEVYSLFQSIIPSSRGANLYVSLTNYIRKMLIENYHSLSVFRDIPENQIPFFIDVYSYGIAGYMTFKKIDTSEDKDAIIQELKDALLLKSVK